MTAKHASNNSSSISLLSPPNRTLEYTVDMDSRPSANDIDSQLLSVRLPEIVSPRQSHQNVFTKIVKKTMMTAIPSSLGTSSLDDQERPFRVR